MPLDSTFSANRTALFQAPSSLTPQGSVSEPLYGFSSLFSYLSLSLHMLSSLYISLLPIPQFKPVLFSSNQWLKGIDQLYRA
jgi:hypothetical protein